MFVKIVLPAAVCAARQIEFLLYHVHEIMKSEIYQRTCSTQSEHG